MKKSKKNKITLILIFLYCLTGICVYILGGETRDLSFWHKTLNAITVIILWPFLIVGKIFFN